MVMALARDRKRVSRAVAFNLGSAEAKGSSQGFRRWPVKIYKIIWIQLLCRNHQVPLTYAL